MDPEPAMSGASSARNIDNNASPFMCKICSKAFTKRDSRNRHVLYCRKKLGANLPVLRKSCAACRQAKAKCNSELPSCRRCDERSLSCVYELTSKSATATQSPSFVVPDKPNSDSTLLVEVRDPASHNAFSSDVNLDDTRESLISLDVEASDPWTAHISDLPSCNDLAFWEPSAGFVEDLNDCNISTNLLSDFCSVNESSANWFISGPRPSLAFDPTFLTPPDCMFHTPYLVIRPMDYQLALTSGRSPFIHSYTSPGSQIGRTFILQNLKSYATALASNILPPFIHSTSLHFTDPSSSQGPTCATPPPLPILEICKSIISLYTTKTPATSSFVWRTITMEKDRFMNEYLNADEWTVLSMLQGFTLYVLLRICDQDSFSVEFDYELIRCITQISIRSHQTRLVCSAEIEGRRPEWKEWVFVESRRRTVTVLFILYLLFDIKPENREKSKIGLSVIPLPAQKCLWEAKTESEWEEKYDEMLRARDGRGYLRYADLMALGRGRGGVRMNDLKEWMVSGDMFGVLVNMAAMTL